MRKLKMMLKGDSTTEKWLREFEEANGLLKYEQYRDKSDLCWGTLTANNFCIRVDEQSVRKGKFIGCISLAIYGKIVYANFVCDKNKLEIEAECNRNPDRRDSYMQKYYPGEFTREIAPECILRMTPFTSFHFLPTELGQGYIKLCFNEDTQYCNYETISSAYFVNTMLSDVHETRQIMTHAGGF